MIFLESSYLAEIILGGVASLPERTPLCGSILGVGLVLTGVKGLSVPIPLSSTVFLGGGSFSLVYIQLLYTSTWNEYYWANSSSGAWNCIPSS